MMMANPMNGQYQAMRNGQMPNGAPNELKRAALQNNRPYTFPTPTTTHTQPSANAQQQRQPHGGHAAHEEPQHDGRADAT
jgi:hypothetical protein